MRKLEIQANEAFDTYREMYYEGGVSSVFLWDPEDPSGGSNFAGVVVLKKSTPSPLRSSASSRTDADADAGTCSDVAGDRVRAVRVVGLDPRLRDR